MEIFESIFHSLMKTWLELPLVLQAFVLTVLFVSAIVQTIKKSFLTKLPKKSKKMWIWRISFVVGCASGYYGSTFGTVLYTWQWVLIGGMSGSASNGLHWLSVKIFWPYIQKRFSKNA